jgi:hypothetical protein
VQAAEIFDEIPSASLVHRATSDAAARMACALLLTGKHQAQKGCSEKRNDEEIQGDGGAGSTSLVGHIGSGQFLPPWADSFGRGSRTGSTVPSALARLALGAGMTVLAAIVVATHPACSTSQSRDMNYGTDVGLFYVPPGADNTISDDAASMDMESADSADSAVVDGGTSTDAPAESAL